MGDRLHLVSCFGRGRHGTSRDPEVVTGCRVEGASACVAVSIDLVRGCLSPTRVDRRAVYPAIKQCCCLISVAACEMGEGSSRETCAALFDFLKCCQIAIALCAERGRETNTAKVECFRTTSCAMLMHMRRGRAS